MEIGFREWLIVGAIIVILLIIVDGWRRMRAQSNSLKIDIDDKLSDLGEDSYNPELPLGTARVFKPKDNEQKKPSAETEKNAAKGREQSNTQLPAIETNKIHTKVIINTAVNNSRPAIDSNSLPLPAAEEPVIESSTSSNIDINDGAPNIDAINSKAVRHQGYDENLNEDIISKPRLPTKTKLSVTAQALREDASTVATSSLENIHTVDSTIEVTPSKELNQTADIGFSALDSSVDTIDIDAEKESFTVPDILKKENFTKNDIEHHSRKSSNALAEQSQNSPAEEISVSKGEINTNSSENMVAATEDTDHIVNSLLHNLALSKQETVEKTADFQLPVSSIPEQSEDYIDKHASESNVTASVDFGPDKFEQLLAERDQKEFLAAPISTPRHQLNEMSSPYTSIEQLEKQLKAAVDEPLSINTGTSIDNEYDTGEVAVSDPDINADDEYNSEISPTPVQMIEVAIEETYNGENSDTNYNNFEDQTEQLSQLTPNYSNAERQTDLHDIETLAEENDHLTEIEILKARLKELAPQELVQSVQTSELNESVIVNRVDSFDERFEARAEQIDQQAADNLTTVIDDDVSLEDLNSEISIQNLDSLNPNSADSLEQSTAKMISQPDLDQSADPLMDGFQNSVATNDLMSQFEHDLKQDGQAVANELDLPITEIIKKNKAAPAELPAINEGTLDASTSSGFDHSQVDSNQQNHFESDPLFDNNMLSESVLSGDDFDDDQQDTALNNNELSINEGDNLGFTALEQGYDNDPLMSGFDKRESEFKEEQQDSLEDKLPSQKKPLIENDQDSEQASYQESLFIEPEAVNSIQTPAKVAKTSRKVIANVEDPNAVLIVTVVAKDQYLNGAVLRHVVEACGMEFGDMKVFHRFEDGADQGAVQFSMANAINPGTFNIDDMDDTATPGVSFFMSMDEPIDPKKAFECMIATAETVATHLNGDLLDDDRSVIRPQTKEHYRERVRIHEMNKLRRRAL